MRFGRRLATLMIVVVASGACSASSASNQSPTATKVERAIARSVNTFFANAKSRPERAVALVEHGDEFLPFLRAIPDRTLQGSLSVRLDVRVTDVKFRSLTEAAVTTRQRSGPPNGFSGTVTKPAGRWRLTASYACSVIRSIDYKLGSPQRCNDPLSWPPASFAPPVVAVFGAGPSDRSAAVTQIQRAFHAVFGFSTNPERRAKTIEDGDALIPLIRDNDLSFGTESYDGEPWITSIVFRGPERADVGVTRVRADDLAPGEKERRVDILGGALIEEARWKVTRDTYCLSLQGEGHEPACPRSGPARTYELPPALSLQSKKGVPPEAGRLAVLDSHGDVWIVNASGPTRMSDVGPRGPESRGAYIEARFGPKGEVYAERPDRGDLVIERLERPGVAHDVARIPDADRASRKAGYVPGFSATPHGIVLLYLSASRLACPPDSVDCFDDNEGGWVAELRPWNALDREGRRSAPVATWPTMATLNVALEGETTDGSVVTIGYHYNKPYGGRSAISVPALVPRECCAKVSDQLRAVLRALSDDGSAVAVIDDGSFTVSKPHLRVPQVLIIGRNGKPLSAYRPESWSISRNTESHRLANIAWGGRFLAFGMDPVNRGQSYTLTLVDMKRGIEYDTGVVFSGIRSLDFFGVAK